tara:strand:+ start:483 stop:1181 length:699 start_codon:yes stop_codon:yes gene_type:complete
MENFINIFFEISYVFCGFIFGIYFEKFNEKRKDLSWRANALRSIKFDLETDYKLFKKTEESDQKQLDHDKKILEKIDGKTDIEIFFSLLDELNDNTQFDPHFGNVTQEDYDFIDLNRVNYDSFLKYGNKDSVDDNELKGYLDWIFEGLTYLYKSQVNDLRKAKSDLDNYSAQIGYSINYKKPIPERYDTSYILHFKALYSNYLILREKHLTIKKKIISSLKKIPEKIDEVLT